MRPTYATCFQVFRDNTALIVLTLTPYSFPSLSGFTLGADRAVSLILCTCTSFNLVLSRFTLFPSPFHKQVVPKPPLSPSGNRTFVCKGRSLQRLGRVDDFGRSFATVRGMTWIAGTSRREKTVVH